MQTRIKRTSLTGVVYPPKRCILMEVIDQDFIRFTSQYVGTAIRLYFPLTFMLKYFQMPDTRKSTLRKESKQSMCV